MSGLYAEALNGQRLAADPAASAWVSASAGSGKTKVLIDRLLNLLLAGASPHRLLCLTYTKAAAAEMSNRLTQKLAVWTTLEEARLADDLADLTGEIPDARRLSQARRLFALVLDAPGGLRIQTLHAFAQSLLARFPLEAGIAPHFEVMDERDQGELLGQALNGLLAQAGAQGDGELTEALALLTQRLHETRFGDLMRELTQARSRLTRLFETHGGKEGVLRALADCLEIPIDATPEQLVANACRDGAFDGDALRGACKALLGGAKTDQERGRAMAAWLADGEEGRGRAFDAYLQAFLTGELEPRARLAAKAAKEALPGIEDILLAEQRRLLEVLERKRAAVCLQATGALLVLAWRMLDAYRDLKSKRARLDYDDLIQSARKLIREGTSWVLYKLDEGIDHVLIDEAQDTSPDQWDIVDALASEFFAGESARPMPRTVFAVGDVKQSIYSFQGADPQAFEAMRANLSRRVPEGGGTWRAIDLVVSFRSTRAVLEAVDAVFGEGGVELGQDYKYHLAFRAKAGGRAELWPPLEPAPLDEPAPWRPPVEAIRGDSQQIRMARLLARRIRAMLDGERLESKGRPIQPGDILILLRRRGGFAQDLVRELKRENVPVAGVDRMVVTEQIAVADLMALARFVLMPEDDLNLAAVLKGPFLDFDEERLFNVCFQRTGSLWEALQDKEAQAARWLSGLLALADLKPPYDFFAHLLGPLGGRRLLAARLGAESLDAVDEFLSLALDYESRYAPQLTGFLGWMEASRVEIKRDPDTGREGRVRLMTVHGAKGLQAPIVFLPDTLTAPQGRDMLTWTEKGGVGLPLWVPLSSERPGRMRIAVEAERQRLSLESQRLLYVAMTRAEDRLIVCGWRPGREIQGAWHPLVSRGFQRVLAREETDPFLESEADAPKDPVLVLSCPQEEEAKTKQDEILDLPPAILPDWAKRPAPPEPSPGRPLIPSRPEGGEGAPLSPLGGDGGYRFRRGLLVHRLLQTLPDLDPASRPKAALRYLEHAALDWSETDRLALVGEVLAVLDSPDFAPLFGPDSKAEAPLAGLFEGRVLSGQVDRLALVGDEAWIVDYKTNRPPPADPAGVPAVYRRQMELYRLAAGHLWPGRRLRTFLLWTDGPRLMEI